MSIELIIYSLISLYLAARQQSANHVTIEELLDPNGRFVEHSINVRIMDNGWIDRQMDGWMDGQT